MTVATVGAGIAAVSFEINDTVRANDRRSSLGVNLSLLASQKTPVTFNAPNDVSMTLTQQQLVGLARASSFAARIRILESAFRTACGSSTSFDVSGNALRALHALGRIHSASLRAFGTTPCFIALRSDSNDVSNVFVREASADSVNSVPSATTFDSPLLRPTVSMGALVRIRGQ